MCVNVTVFIILLIKSTITQAFFIHNHQKYSKYHSNNIQSNNKNKNLNFNTRQYINYHVPAQSFINPYQTHVRSTFSNNQFKLEQSNLDANVPSATLNQCIVRFEDFTRPSFMKSVFCTWNNELIITKDQENQFWCVVYSYKQAKKKNKKVPVLFLKLDRSYQVGYSPGGIKTEKQSNLGIKLILQENSLNTIIIRAAFDGLPEIVEIEFKNKKICKMKIPSKQTTVDDSSSEEDNFHLAPAHILDKLLPIPFGKNNDGLTVRQEFQDDEIALTKQPEFQLQPRESTIEQRCGLRQVHANELISNGKAAKTSDWPFHATIFHTSVRTFNYKCGGIIISRTLILTAAHCVLENGNQIIPERVKVHLGQGSLANIDGNSQGFEVYEIMCHEHFNRGTVKHDIALLKLTTNIAFTTFIQPACLPEEDFTMANKIGIVIGFGRTESGQLSPVLREARMLVPNTMDCLESNRDFFGLFLYDGNFCAGHLEENAVACTGDSGGGMYFNVNGNWVVRGIVSIGMKDENDNEGCFPKSYVIYTDIFKYMTWIKQKM